LRRVLEVGQDRRRGRTPRRLPSRQAPGRRGLRGPPVAAAAGSDVARGGKRWWVAAPEWGASAPPGRCPTSRQALIRRRSWRGT